MPTSPYSRGPLLRERLERKENKPEVEGTRGGMRDLTSNVTGGRMCAKFDTLHLTAVFVVVKIRFQVTYYGLTAMRHSSSCERCDSL